MSQPINVSGFNIPAPLPGGCDAGNPPAIRLSRAVLAEIEQVLRHQPWQRGCVGHTACLIAALYGHIAALDAEQARRELRAEGDRQLAERRTSPST